MHRRHLSSKSAVFVVIKIWKLHPPKNGLELVICQFYGSSFQSHSRPAIFCSFCCLILKIGVSYHIILMYYLNYEHTGLQTVLPLLHVVILLVIYQ